MATNVAFWSVELQPGKPRTVMMPDLDLHVTNVALGEEIADPNGRTVLKLVYSRGVFDNDEDDEEDENEDEDEEKQVTTVLCSLTPGKVEHASINVILNRESIYILQSTGKNTIYISGQFIDQELPDQDPFDDESDMDSEDAYDLQDVSSDVEMHPDDLEGLESDASRFEEIEDEPPATKGQKRPRDSDVVTETKAESGKEGKKSKKMKGEKGDAVPVESHKEEKKDKKKEKKSGEEKAAPAKKTLPSGVIIQDAKVGTGPTAKKGSTVRMRYVGKFPDGKVFDKNTSGKPFTFHLGKGEVIKGWDEGIVGMQVGGERALVIPPALAYGKRPPPGIPPNATLHFEVKLLEIK